MQCVRCFYEKTEVIVCSSDKSTEWRRYTDKSKTDMWKGVDPDKRCEYCWARTEEENNNRTLRSGSRGGGGCLGMELGINKYNSSRIERLK